MPKVSICIPSLNTRRFLEERRQSIEDQTFKDFEVIVVDDASTDGSREFFEGWADQDSRVSVNEGPGKGLYAGWNDCIARATGDYVYIATSDDTMADNCLEKLVEALDANPSCGIAHCALEAIGEGADDFNRLWKEELLFAQSSGSLREQPHIRKSPFDALLLLTGHTVYISVTQLLIRRELFEQIGLYDGRWGGSGDFHWQMRASISTDTVHVPSTWGGWRLHASQATSLSEIDSPQHREKIEEMIDDALRVSWDCLPTDLQKGLQAGWRRRFYDQWHFNRNFRLQRGTSAKAWFLAKNAIAGSKPARDQLAQRLFGKAVKEEPPHVIVSQWLESVGIENPLGPSA